MEKIKVALEDSHGQNTPGKRTPSFPDGKSIRENEFSRPAVNMLETALLRCRMFDVLQVAPELKDVPLSERVRRANEWGADIYVSIHYNAQDSKWGGTEGGIETYFYPGSIKGRKLATYIHVNLIQGTPQENRGVKESRFYVLRKTAMPAVLIEAGFMDVKKEANLILDEDFQRETAEEVCQGICEYFGVEYARPGE